MWTIPRGVMHCPVTPMFEDGRVDFATFEKVVEFHLRQKPVAICTLLHIAESLNLTLQERKELTEVAIKVTAGRAPVMVHVSMPGTDDAIDLARHAQRVGAASVCSITPYYWNPPEEAVFAHYVALASSVDIPVVGYNSPLYQGGVSLTPRLLVRLVERLPNFVGIKEASHSFEYIIETLRQVRAVRPDFGIVNGIEYIYPIVMLGCEGTMTILGGIAPRIVTHLWEACEAGEQQRARELQDKVSHLWQILKVGYPAAIKAAMGIMGRPVGRTRLPILPFTDEQTAALRSQLEALRVLELEDHGW